MSFSYLEFFDSATGNKPYLWQCRLACGEPPDGASCDLEEPDKLTLKWLSGGTDCNSKLIDIPTGLGKTAGVVLAWLWNRLRVASEQETESFNDTRTWSRRLVYCLPMRTLVEQTEGEVEKWLKNLAQTGDEGRLQFGSSAKSELLWLIGDGLDKPAHSPVVLMGGEDLDPAKRAWDVYPEKSAILIGTQDMLLSRALNRGYGMSRYRWPMHFGLLNNDALWVMDEVQLMGVGLWTSAQLDWMRELRFKPWFPVKTWWMSATLGGDFLQTSDRRNEKMLEPDLFRLHPQEVEALPVLRARRPVLEFKLKPPAKKSAKGNAAKLSSAPTETVVDQLANHVLENHVSGSLSLIVCNRVAFAQEVHRAFSGKNQTEKLSVELLTSRFRPDDRQCKLDAILAFEKARKAGQPHPGLILVSTQVVEAGFDVSATLLWTQLAPWPSLIQRLGRLNRDGNSNALAKAFLFEFPEDKKDPHFLLPYEKADLKEARMIVDTLIDLCAKEPDLPIREILHMLGNGPLKNKVEQALEPKPQPYPRALDVHGLFSTEPDLFGGFTDVSPWIRNADASADVTVFWRDFEEKGDAVNKGNGPGFQRGEGCSVAVYHLRNFLGTNKRAHQWNPKSDKWETIRLDDIRPGMTLLLPAKAGGYEIEEGWTGRNGGNLGNVPAPGSFTQSDAEDRETQVEEWIPLERHLSDTEEEAISIAKALGFTSESVFGRALIRSGALHDIGKSLAQWQLALLQAHKTESSDRKSTLWAKSPRGTVPFRPGLRHEAASALAMWHQYYREGLKNDFPALAIYLVAAHHGKVRTVLATRPSIREPNTCGIPIPQEAPPVAPLPWPSGWQMDFSAVEDGASGYFSDDGSEFIFGSPGWTGLVADLLGGWEKDAAARTSSAVPESEPAALGPFALVYFESLLRAADGRSSATFHQETSGS